VEERERWLAAGAVEPWASAVAGRERADRGRGVRSHGGGGSVFPFLFPSPRAPVRPVSVPAILFPGGGRLIGPPARLGSGSPSRPLLLLRRILNCLFPRVLPLVRASPLTPVGRRRRGWPQQLPGWLPPADRRKFTEAELDSPGSPTATCWNFQAARACPSAASSGCKVRSRRNESCMWAEKSTCGRRFRIQIRSLTLAFSSGEGTDKNEL
jgi:hypothetical protein